MIKASVNLQELRRKIYSKAKTDSAGSGGVRKRFTGNGVFIRTTGYPVSTRKQLQADRYISFVAKRTGKPYEGAKLDRRETNLTYGLRWQGMEKCYGEPKRARGWKRRTRPRGHLK